MDFAPIPVRRGGFTARYAPVRVPSLMFFCVEFAPEKSLRVSRSLSHRPLEITPGGAHPKCSERAGEAEVLGGGLALA
jgi:hypothetical protein